MTKQSLKRAHTPEIKSDPLDHEWNTPKRAKVKTLRQDVGKSARDVQALTGVPPRTQRRILHQSDRRPNKSGRTKRGVPSKIDQDTVEKMIKALEGHYNRRTWDWEELRSQFELECTWQTVRSTMNQAGYHKCRACQKSWINENQAKKRVGYSEEHVGWQDWKIKQVHWSDECHFHQNSRHTDFVIRNKHERYCADCIQKRRRTAASQFSV